MRISGRSDADSSKARGILRRLFLVLFAIGFLLLAALAVFIFQKKPRIDYSATNRLADLVYLGTWLAILMAGVVACLWRRGLPIAFVIFLLLLAETAAHAYVFATTGAIYQPEP